jgi:hypothetical protein
MNIQSKTTEEIKAHILLMCDTYTKTGKKLYLDIKAECENELNRRSQKKGEAPKVQPERAQENQLQEQVIVSQKVESSFNLEVQKAQITLYKKDPIQQTEQQLQDMTRKYFGVVFTLRKFQDGIKNSNIDSLLGSISFYNLCQYFAGLKQFRKVIELKDVLIDHSKYSTAKKKNAQILLDYLESKIK